MRENFYTFPRTHKMFLITNNPPRVVEEIRKQWRRLKRIPFDVVIPPEERDPHLIDKLKNESAGILNWLIAGCLAWQETGLGEPAAVTTATAGYRAESDPLTDFIEERCTTGLDQWTSTKELYAAYIQHMNRTREALDEKAVCRIAGQASRHDGETTKSGCAAGKASH